MSETIYLEFKSINDTWIQRELNTPELFLLQEEFIDLSLYNNKEEFINLFLQNNNKSDIEKRLK